MIGTNDPTSTDSPVAMPARLQTAANIAVILASMSVVSIAWQRMHPATPQSPPTYAVGDRIDAVEGIDFRASPHTLLIALREHCRFCQDSVPFYQRLTAAVADAAEGVQLAVVSTDTRPSMSAYLSDHGIRVDRVISIRAGALRIPGTPHLLLVDSSATVKRVWRGRLPPSQEQEVFAALGLAAMN